ncbi:MAG: sulfotransferase [Actinobacteria bacterium]|nr:sulfotransferase [Actinomycetota bacterium]
MRQYLRASRTASPAGGEEEPLAPLGPTIVFVAGYGRTGSTLLDRLLGQVEGFASFGELRHVWDRGFIGNQLCGCGSPFHVCPFWMDVAGRAFGSMDRVDAHAVSRDKRAVDELWQVPRMLTGGWTRRYRERFGRYRAAVEALYRAMAEVSGARFLVDSSKDPNHAFVLGTIPGFDVRVVHLVRDGRAVAFSWRRARARPEITWRTQDMPRFPALRTALAYDATNLAAHATRLAGQDYTFLRYEDLVGDLRGELGRVLGGIGAPEAPLDFLGPDGTATLGTAHTVAGNPVRFQEGPVPVRADEEWRERMAPGDRLLVEALTFPFLLAYGYLGRGRPLRALLPPAAARRPGPRPTGPARP